MNLSINALLEEVEKSAGIEKQASATEEVTPSVSQSISDIMSGKTTEEMHKRASEEGASLAKELLAKMAAETNLIPIQTDQLAAEDDKKIEPAPTGTLEDNLQSLVDTALDRGATSDDRVDDSLDAGKGVSAGDPVDPPTEYPAQTEKKANDMTTNSALAKQILEKLAETGAAPISTDTSNQTNMIIQNDQRLTASDDKKIAPLPGAGGTISNIYEQVVATAQAQGAGSDDLVTPSGGTEPAQRLDTADQTEKAAAVSELVAQGLSFDVAVDLVKQAEQELLAEEVAQEKQAAVNALIQEGYDFDTAVDLVKKAEHELEKEAAFAELRNEGYDFDTAVALVKQAEEELVKEAASISGLAQLAKSTASKVGNSIKGDVNMAKKLGPKDNSLGKRALRAANTTSGRVAIGAAAGAAAGASMKKSAEEIGQEKQAAFNTLVESGVDFDTATALIAQAEQDLYGK